MEKIIFAVKRFLFDLSVLFSLTLASCGGGGGNNDSGGFYDAETPLISSHPQGAAYRLIPFLIHQGINYSR
ncbi:MAG: hypothetical protein LBD73_08935 [Deferribacteraceae bacterium]|jgi:hypothetical protein|nr:hypothetical protein [Deferribacteraceae bacterium]